MTRNCGISRTLLAVALNASLLVLVFDPFPGQLGKNPGSVPQAALAGSAETGFGRVPGRLPGEQCGAAAAHVLRLRLPAGSLLVMQSLDITGSSHTFRLRAGAGDGAGDSAAEFSETAAVRCISVGQARLSGSAVRGPVAGGSRLPDGPVVFPAGDASAAVWPARRLLLPVFTAAGVRELAAECRCVYRGAVVTVYADPKLIPAEPPQSARLCSLLERHLQRGSGTLRTAVESLLGAIDDVDGDGRLTVVLTRLDHRVQPDSPGSDIVPVLGCVREADFLDPHSEFGGDILYLAPEGLLDAGGESLLAHELSHAAVHSRQRERLQAGRPKLEIPGWFHESLAHFAEHSAAGPGQHFERRLEAFHLHPQASPIVQHFAAGWDAGRGGSRAAGLMFLQSALQPSANAPELLRTCSTFTELLEGMLQQPFTESLADWGPVAAEQILRSKPLAIPNLLPGGAHTGRLRGTALQCWRNDGGQLTIEVEAARAAEIRLSVLLCEDGASGLTAD